MTTARKHRRHPLLRALVIAVVVAAVGGFAASRSFLSAGAAAFRITRTASAADAWTPDKPMYILLLGSDLRPGAGCGCSDAIHLVGIPAGGGRATIINIPRDSRIDVPGHGLHKLTEAMSLGGPELTAQAIGNWVGVPISYTMVTSFDGLTNLINAMGGVIVNLAAPVQDSNTNVNLPAGATAIDGDLALRLARSRHIPGGDLVRTENQAQIIIGALATLQQKKQTSPGDTVNYLAILSRYVTLQGMSTSDLYRLARLGMSIYPTNIRSVVVPSHGALISGTSYVIPDASASGLFSDFADDAVLETH
jgi:LCP family protein required for cell wall assembly